MKTCSKCGQERPDETFPIDHRYGRPMKRCQPCLNETQRAWRASKPGYERAVYLRSKQNTRERHLKRKYGVSLASYDAMLAAQDGKCAICGTLEENQFKGVFHVDHCHSTGRVRGLLCRGCNHMLGVVKDNSAVLERAIDYLRVPQVAAEVIGAFMDTEGATA